MNENNAEPMVPPPADAETLRRREFLHRLCLGLGGVAGLGLVVPTAGFILAPLLRNVPPEWRPVGKADDFKIGETTDVIFTDASPLPWAGVTAKTAAWLRRESEQGFIAFSVNCTHLGCPVRWQPRAKLFMCPCHGGVYYANGDVAGGPPPRPLPRYEVRLRDGQVEIRTGPVPITTLT